MAKTDEPKPFLNQLQHTKSHILKYTHEQFDKETPTLESEGLREQTFTTLLSVLTLDGQQYPLVRLSQKGTLDIAWYANNDITLLFINQKGKWNFSNPDNVVGDDSSHPDGISPFFNVPQIFSWGWRNPTGDKTTFMSDDENRKIIHTMQPRLTQNQTIIPTNSEG